MSEQADATPSCPKCGGDMWDNRENKRNPRAPDFKCKDRNCEGVIWPARDGSPSPYPPSAPRRNATSGPPRDDVPFPDEPPMGDDDLPF